MSQLSEIPLGTSPVNKTGYLTAEEQQRIEQLELQIAWIKKKFPIQFKSNHGPVETWCDCKQWLTGFIYRRKPTKKVVELSPVDINFNQDLFKHSTWPEHFKAKATEMNDKEIHIGTRGWRTFKQLHEDGWQRSTDGGKTWLPCSKEVEG